MHKNIRHTIFIIFIIAFLITAPLVIGYSMGYRYNFKKQKIESVGALFLDSIPNDTKIFINQKRINKKMPAKIIDLSPSQYNVRVEKDGYYPWTKNLEIKSNETTFAQKINLFKKSESQKLINENINLFIPSPEKTKILYSIKNNTWEELKIHDIDYPEKTDILLYRKSIKEIGTNLKPENISWSPQGNALLITIENKSFILSIDRQNNLIPLTDLIKSKAEHINWNRGNDNSLNGITKNNFFSLDLNTLLVKEIDLTIPRNTTIIDLLATDTDIFTIEKQNNSIKLFQSKKIDPKTRKYILELDDSNYKLIYHNNEYISLEHITKQKSYLVHTNEQPTYLILNGKHIRFDSKSKKILYHNEFEINIITLTNTNSIEKESLITRYSTKINHTEWHPSDEYIFVATDTTFQIIEIDERDQRNIINILTANKIKDFVSNKKATRIYVHDDENIIYIDLSEKQNFIENIVFNY